MHTFNGIYFKIFIMIVPIHFVLSALHRMWRFILFHYMGATKLFCCRKYSNFSGNGKFVLHYGKLLRTSGIKIHRHRAYNSFPRLFRRARASRFSSRNSYSYTEIALELQNHLVLQNPRDKFTIISKDR